MAALCSMSARGATSNYPVIQNYTATSGTGNSYGNQGYGNLFDSNINTKWCAPAPSTESPLYVEFYSQEPFIPQGYQLITADDNATYGGRIPKDWTIKAKLRAEDNWTVLTEVKNDAVLRDANFTTFEFPLRNTNLYKYFRLEISANKGAYAFQLSEFNFRGIVQGTTDYLFFNYDDESLTATVTGYDTESELTNMVIPPATLYEGTAYTVTAIDAFAFMDGAFTSVAIPFTVTQIAEDAFLGCVSLTSIEVEEGNTVYDSRQDCNAIIETATNTLIYGCASTVIPDDVTAIGEAAFTGVEFSSVTIPASVTSIGAFAFSQTNLTDVYCYAAEPPSLGDMAFSYDNQGTTIPTTLHVLASSIDAYMAADGWCDFREIVETANPIETELVLVSGGVEYFINLDPGLGMGTFFETTDENVQLSVPAERFQMGLNVIGLRPYAVYDNGKTFYSPTVLRHVYRYHAEDAQTAALEYFIGKDPGIGKAKRVSITSDETGNVVFNIPDTELKYGINMLGIRLLSTHSEESTEEFTYSPTVYNSVYRYHAEDAQTVGVEYFLNDDPGISKANFVSATGDEISFNIDREQMKEGINVLGLRAVSRNSESGTVYSPTRYQYVYRPAATGIHHIERIEYFWDEDPGKGKGKAISFETIGDSAVVNDCIIDYAGLYGMHVLSVRAMSHGVWSTLYQQAVILPTGILSGNLTLDPNVEEDTDNGVFSLLPSLLSALSTRGFTAGLNVNVADAVYNFQVSEESILFVQSLYNYLMDMNFYISMKAPNSATFNFVIPMDFIMNHASELPQIVAAVQAMFSHIVTENISILINGQAYEYNGFQVEPNDLLALKNLYNRLGGENWTEKKWSFHSNGRDKSELPGVEFDDQGRVTRINLENNNLVGKLTKDYNLLLPELTYLNLNYNYLSGDLSPFLAELTKLKTVYIDYNNISEISSPLPESVTSLSHYNQFRKKIGNTIAIDTAYTHKLKPLMVYMSGKQSITLPTIFTYNYSKRDYSNMPVLSVLDYKTSNTSYGQIGALNASGQHYQFNYMYSWAYNQQQDLPVYVVIDDSNGSNYHYDLSAYPAKLRYVLGDANMSGYTDVLDVQHTLNRILATASPFNFSAANTYTDEIINVQDIVCTVNIVLDNEQQQAGTTQSAASHRAGTDNGAKAWLYTANGQLMLAANTEVGALDIELQGVSTSQVSLLLNHSQFQMMGRNTATGSRYVIFSPTGQAIPAGEMSALLKLSGNAHVVGAQVSDMTAEEIGTVLNQQPTGIGQLMDGTLAARFQGNLLMVKATREMNSVELRLTSTGGAVLLSTTLNRVVRGETALNVNVVPGIYILEMKSANGARRIVKLMKR